MNASSFFSTSSFLPACRTAHPLLIILHLCLLLLLLNTSTSLSSPSWSNKRDSLKRPQWLYNRRDSRAESSREGSAKEEKWFSERTRPCVSSYIANSHPAAQPTKRQQVPRHQGCTSLFFLPPTLPPFFPSKKEFIFNPKTLSLTIKC